MAFRSAPAASCAAGRSGVRAANARSWRELGALRVVDLRALQLARVVDVYRLPLGVHVERRAAGLAMAITGRLHAAEGELDLGADRAGVHVHDPGLRVAHETKRVVHVARVD